MTEKKFQEIKELMDTRMEVKEICDLLAKDEGVITSLEIEAGPRKNTGYQYLRPSLSTIVTGIIEDGLIKLLKEYDERIENL